MKEVADPNLGYECVGQTLTAPAQCWDTYPVQYSTTDDNGDSYDVLDYEHPIRECSPAISYCDWQGSRPKISTVRVPATPVGIDPRGYATRYDYCQASKTEDEIYWDNMAA